MNDATIERLNETNPGFYVWGKIMLEGWIHITMADKDEMQITYCDYAGLTSWISEQHQNPKVVSEVYRTYCRTKYRLQCKGAGTCLYTHARNGVRFVRDTIQIE